MRSSLSEALEFVSNIIARSLVIHAMSCLHLGQKPSPAIILGGDYRHYSQARTLLNIPELEVLREEACLRLPTKLSRAQITDTTLCNTRNQKKALPLTTPFG